MSTGNWAPLFIEQRCRPERQRYPRPHRLGPRPPHYAALIPNLTIEIPALPDAAAELLECSDLVLRRLAEAIEQGFVVSVDLVYGLTGQSISGFLDTILRLVKLGIHGFSLYRLNVSKRNRRALSRIGELAPDPWPISAS